MLQQAAAAAAPGPGSTFEDVKEYYGKVLSTSANLKTNACTAAGRPHRLIRDIMQRIPAAVSDKFYGCGAPLLLGIKGLRVLDLGSGSGRDCYVCAALVGEQGSVIGVDMTEEQIQVEQVQPAIDVAAIIATHMACLMYAKQIQVAKDHAASFCQQLGYSKANMHFIKGHIEYLDKAGIPDDSINIVISNCVINLSPDKQRVLQEAYRVLAPGGEFYFSDVYCDRRLPQDVRDHKVLWGECISGALYCEDFKRLAQAAGFTAPREICSSPIDITDVELQEVVGNARFRSVTYRLFNLPDLLETQCEDYGQTATYKGTIPGHTHSYSLDDHHHFQTGKPMLVCGNTAAMLGERGLSWLSKHFSVTGDRSTHYGLYPCSSPAAGQPTYSGAPEAPVSASPASCCAPKSSGSQCC